MAKYYITTPIYYVNDIATIGHAYTTIIELKTNNSGMVLFKKSDRTHLGRKTSMLIAAKLTPTLRKLIRWKLLTKLPINSGILLVCNGMSSRNLNCPKAINNADAIIKLLITGWLMSWIRKPKRNRPKISEIIPTIIARRQAASI